MEDLAFGELAIQIDAARSPALLTLVWRGKSQDRQPGRILDPYLDGVVKAAEKLGAVVEMRFEKLEYLNSSTLTAIIGVVQQARHRQVRLVIVFDKTLKWQKLSFDALRVLGKGDNLLEIRAV